MRIGRFIASLAKQPALTFPVASGLELWLDAGKAASYSGSGGTWHNLVATPASGAGQAAYDMTNLNGRASFNGAAGAGGKTNYWSMPGAGNQGFQVGATTAFLNSLAEASAAFTVMLVMKYATSGATNPCFFTTYHASTGSHSGMVFHAETGTANANCSAWSPTKAVFTGTPGALPTSGLSMWLFSLANGGNWFVNINGTTTYGPASASYSGPGTGAADGLLTLGNDADLIRPSPSGTLFSQFAMWNRAVSTAEAGTIYSSLSSGGRV